MNFIPTFVVKLFWSVMSVDNFCVVISFEHWLICRVHFMYLHLYMWCTLSFNDNYSASVYSLFMNWILCCVHIKMYLNLLCGIVIFRRLKASCFPSSHVNYSFIYHTFSVLGHVFFSELKRALVALNLPEGCILHTNGHHFRRVRVSFVQTFCKVAHWYVFFKDDDFLTIY